MDKLMDAIEAVFSVLIVLIVILYILLFVFAALFGLAEIVWWIITGEFFHIIPVANFSAF